MGVRTVFNILGPLTNPAHAQHQVLGVARPELAPLMAAALQRLGTKHVLVVHGHDGADKLTLGGPCPVYEMNNGQTSEYKLSATDVGLSRADSAATKGGTAEQNSAILASVLSGETGPYRDVVLFNAAAALVAADIANDPKDGLARAAESVDSGAAKKRMDAFVELSASFA
jgi:anthranilate phosphoribosyltransferase